MRTGSRYAFIITRPSLRGLTAVVQIAQWGAVFSPSFTFTDFNLAQLTATLPKSIPNGDVRTYLP